MNDRDGWTERRDARRSAVRVKRQRYGLIEWNGLSGFVSFGLEPGARTGGGGASGGGAGGGAAAGDGAARLELGSVCEPMS
ncbi:MAG: hypothetical protein ACTS3F_10415 [Phycisphaerales bacterium]